MNSRLAPAQGVASYDFAPIANPRAGPVVLSYKGAPLVRVLPRARHGRGNQISPGSDAAGEGNCRPRHLYTGVSGLRLAGRRALADRLFAVAVALAITALVPWNSFSNTSRLFDPAYYFSRLAGPLTANAGALFISSALVLMAGGTRSSAHPGTLWPRLFAAIGALVTLGIGIPFASNIVRGIGQPPWGSTPGLWLSWEIPLFLFLFAVLLAAFWMLRMALGKPERFRSVAVVHGVRSPR